jgi:hypothetical protein
MTSVRRLLGAGAAIAVVGAGVLALPAAAFAADLAPATDAPATTTPTSSPVAPAVVTGNEAFSVSPSGPYSKGQLVTVSASGWPASSAVIILTCPKGVLPKANPPAINCGSFSSPKTGGLFSSVDASGKGSWKINIVEGSLGSVPAYSCSASTACTIGVYGIDADAYKPYNSGALKAYTITYSDAPAATKTAKSGSGTKSPSGSTTSTASSTSGSTTGGGTQLTKTGAGDTATMALTGAGAVLLGAVMVLLTRRRTSASATV